MKKQDQKKSEEERVQRQTKIAMVFQTIWNNPFTAFICINVPFFMFAHIYFLYHPELNGPILGYDYVSVFLASIMHPVLFFDFGYLLSRVSKRYITDKNGKKFSNILVASFYFFSIFYFLICLFPYNNSYARIGLSPLWYYIVAGFSTIVTVFIIMYLPQRLSEYKLKNFKWGMNRLFDFILIDTKDKIDQEKVKQYEVESIELINEVSERF